MKITREITMELNNELAVMGCPFRYRIEDKKCTGNNPHIELVLPSMNYVSSFYVSPTTEFFTWLYAWFRLKGIELSCNNDRSILWSKSGWAKDNHCECCGAYIPNEHLKVCDKCASEYKF